MRVALVSYTFPPVGGAGVGRVLKLAKYLPEHGIEPIVVTAARPSVPVEDPSLLRELPPNLEIHRAPTLEPGYGLKRATWQGAPEEAAARGWGRRALAGALGRAGRLGRAALFPDPQILWQPGARRALAGLLRGRRPPEVALISGPPFSQFLLGPLARRAGAAPILDYRDEWSTYRRVYEMASPLARSAAPPLERALLSRAAAVTAATEGFRANILAEAPNLRPERVAAIPNGYDPDDLPTDPPAPPPDRFVLTYAGTIFRLTRPTGLLGALRRLWSRAPELAQRLEIRIVGRVVDTEMEALRGAEQLGVRLVGYRDKGEAMRELAASHMTLCLLDDAPGAERIYPAKIFELMALRRPCLTIAPEGELASLVRKHRPGPLAHPSDEEAIAQILAEALSAFSAGRYEPRADPVNLERFDRRRIAGAFADLFRRVARSERAPATRAASGP